MTYVWLWLLAVIVAIPVIFFTLYWLAMRGEADQRQLRASGPSLAPKSRRGGPQLETNPIEALPPGLDEGPMRADDTREHLSHALERIEAATSIANHS